MAVVTGNQVCKKTKNKKTNVSQFLKAHISGMLEAIFLNVGMWTTESEGMSIENIVL